MQENNLNTNINEINNNNNSNYKKILLLVVILIIIAVGLIYAYVYYIKNNKNTSILEDKTSTTFPSISVGEDKQNEAYKEVDKNLDSAESEIDEGNTTGLYHIWPQEVSGYTSINTKTSSTSSERLILFSDKQTGNIYKTNYENLENTRLTNTKLDNIYDTHFSKSGDYVLSIQKNINKNTLMLIGSRLNLEEKESSFILNNIDEDVFNIYTEKNMNKNNASLFYYLKRSGKNKTTLNSFNYITGKIREITNLNLTEIFISNDASGFLYLFSNPSNNINQIMITVNKNTGDKKYLELSDDNTSSNNILITKDAGYIKYSNFDKPKEYKLTEIKSYPEKCLSEKNIYIICAYVNNKNYNDLDSWNTGEISFTDDINILNLETKQITNIPISIFSGEALDVYNPSSSNGILLFKNKKDLSLWSLDINSL